MLSGFQKKVSGAAIACLSICVIAAFVVLIFVLLGKFLSVFGAVVLPVIVALIASFIISPIVDFISSKLRIGRTWACILAFAIILAFMAIISIFALPALAGEIARMFASIPEAFHNIAVHLTEKFPNAKDIIIEKLTELKNFVLSEISVGSVMSTLRKISLTASAATGGIMAVCTYLTAIAVTPIYLYYMLTENADFFGRVERNLNFLDKSLLDDILFMLRRFTEIMTTFFRGQLTIALIMGALFGTGLFLAGVKFGFLLGFAAGMLNIIPYFGTMVGFSRRRRNLACGGKSCDIRRSANGGRLFAHPEDYGRPDRAASNCHYILRIFLGNSARRNTGNDSCYSAYGIHSRAMAKNTAAY